jgi:hypothetical protein
MSSPPEILFLNDFPPSNQNGGTVLIRRLLSGYPTAKLIALTDSRHNKRLDPNSQWCAHHVSLPYVRERGRWGLARLMALLNLAAVPLIALSAARLIRGRPVSVIVSVASGTYFLAAAIVSSRMKIPWILIVHDDWVPIVSSFLPLPRSFFSYLMGFALRRASHIFAVSVGMQEMLKSRYGVDSELQMPAAEQWDLEPGPDSGRPPGHLRMLYMGNGVSAQDSLDLLINLIRQETPKRDVPQSVELHLCTPFTVDPHPNITQHGWVTENEARRQIAASDVLFLPYSFAAEDRPVTLASFPAKSADYLASGKAILVLAPRESTIVQYFDQMRCAELVTQLDRDALTQALDRMAGEEYRRRLASNAHQAWDTNHNVRRQQERFIEVAKELAGEGGK